MCPKITNHFLNRIFGWFHLIHLIDSEDDVFFCLTTDEFQQHGFIRSADVLTISDIQNSIIVIRFDNIFRSFAMLGMIYIVVSWGVDHADCTIIQ